MNDQEFMLKEHDAGFHTSEDWAVLKDRCSECYAMIKKYGSGVIAGVSFKRTLDFLEDFKLSKNPLEK